jgi:hypothetical protein
VAKIEPLSRDIPWDVKTCLAACMEDADTATGCLVLYLDKDHMVCWSQSGLTTEQMLYALERCKWHLMNGTL